MSYDAGETINLPVVPNGKVKKKRAKNPVRKRTLLAEDQAFEQMGAHVLRVKLRTQAMLGKYAEKLGIKSIGAGRILLAGDNAESAVQNLDEIIQEMWSSSPPVPADTIATFLQVKCAFNRQLMDSGEMYLKSERAVNNDNKGSDFRMSFPAGSPVAVAVGTHDQTKPAQIEEAQAKS